MSGTSLTVFVVVQNVGNRAFFAESGIATLSVALGERSLGSFEVKKLSAGEVRFFSVGTRANAGEKLADLTARLDFRADARVGARRRLRSTARRADNQVVRRGPVDRGLARNAAPADRSEAVAPRRSSIVALSWAPCSRPSSTSPSTKLAVLQPSYWEATFTRRPFPRLTADRAASRRDHRRRLYRPLGGLSPCKGYGISAVGARGGPDRLGRLEPQWRLHHLSAHQDEHRCADFPLRARRDPPLLRRPARGCRFP